MKSTLALGTNYFEENSIPILVGLSCSHPGSPQLGDPPPHPFDLTEVHHHHDFSELVIVTEGVGVQRLEEVDIPISAGDVFLLQGDQSHHFHHRENLELTNIMFDPKEVPIPESILRRIPGYSSIFILEPQHREEHRLSSALRLNRQQLIESDTLAKQMLKEQTEKSSGYEVMLLAKLIELIAYVSRAYDGEKSVESRHLSRVSEVILAIEKDYANPWNLGELVQVSGMSESNLLTLFQDATGQSPMAYLLGTRLQRAAVLLRNTNESITEIAFAVGFNDSNYFSRRFSKTMGLTPRDYRKRQI